MSAKSGSLSIVRLHLGPRKVSVIRNSGVSVIRNSGVSAIQGIEVNGMTGRTCGIVRYIVSIRC